MQSVSVTIVDQGGDDALTIRHTAASSSMLFDGSSFSGNGLGGVTLQGAIESLDYASGGSGADVVTVSAFSRVSQIKASLGVGDDTLSIRLSDNLDTVTLTLVGGDGVDSVRVVETNTKRRSVVGYQSPDGFQLRGVRSDDTSSSPLSEVFVGASHAGFESTDLVLSRYGGRTQFQTRATSRLQTRLEAQSAVDLVVLELNGNFVFVGSNEVDEATMLPPPSVVPSNHSGTLDLRFNGGDDKLTLWCLARGANATGTMRVTLDGGDGADELSMFSTSKPLGSSVATIDAARRLLLRGGQYVWDGPRSDNTFAIGNDGLQPSWFFLAPNAASDTRFDKLTVTLGNGNDEVALDGLQVSPMFSVFVVCLFLFGLLLRSVCVSCLVCCCDYKMTSFFFYFFYFSLSLSLSLSVWFVVAITK
jgi:hypothetical protein